MRKGKKYLAAMLAAAMTMTGAVPVLASSEECFVNTEIFLDAAEAEEPTATEATEPTEPEIPTEPTEPTEPAYVQGWNKIDGNKYYMGTDGKLYRGWRKIGNAKYYFHPKTNICVSGLQKISGKSYFFDIKTNKLIVNKLKYKINGKYYSVAKNGVLKLLSNVEKLAADRLSSAAIKQDARKAFLWCAGLKYKNPPMKPSADKAAAYYGEYGFKYKTGDCNVQAYTFCWMMKALGYNAKYVKGYVPQALDKNGKPTNFGAHAWCEIKLGNKTYVYDPNFEGNANYKSLGKYRGYKFTYGAKGHYRYFDSRKREIKRK